MEETALYWVTTSGSELRLIDPLADPRDRHSHEHACFFEGCEMYACKQAQRLAKRNGFDEHGNVAAYSRAA